MPEELLLHIAEAIGLGLLTGFGLWVLRGFAPVRRVWVSVWLAVLLAGLYLVLRDFAFTGVETVAQFIVAAGVMLGANAGLQLFDLVLWEYVISQRRRKVVPRLLIDLFNFIVLVLIGLAVLNVVFGVDLSAFIITSTVLSAVVGLALQDMLSNVVAGLALQIEQPFSVGDWVMVSAQEGTVVQMNWRTLTLHTRDNHNLVVPNSSIARQEIVNYSRPTPLQMIHVTVDVAYRHSPGLVKETIVSTMAALDSVVRTPSPEVLIKSLGESAVVYDVRFWITDYEHLPQITDAVLARIWYGLKRAGLEIPYPSTNVYLHTLAEDHESRVREKLRREVFAELRSLAVFKPLSDSQVEQLAQSARLQRYAIGEVLVQQGDQGDSLYTLKSGRVRVEARGTNGQTNVLANMVVGDFFGEMSLLTGEPRSASVVAESETEVVVVAKADFAAVLQADMSIVESLSMVLEERLRNSQSVTSTDSALNQMPPLSQRPALISRIRGFFGIRQA